MHIQILVRFENCDVSISGQFSEPFSTARCHGCEVCQISPKEVKLTLILLSQDTFFNLPPIRLLFDSGEETFSSRTDLGY
jgi:hypothetical protein